MPEACVAGGLLAVPILVAAAGGGSESWHGPTTGCLPSVAAGARRCLSKVTLSAVLDACVAGGLLAASILVGAFKAVGARGCVLASVLSAISEALVAPDTARLSSKYL